MTVTHIIHAPTQAEIDRAAEEAGVEFANGEIVEKFMGEESNAIEATIVFLLQLESRKLGAVRVYASSMGYRCFPDDPTRFRKPDVSVIAVQKLAGLARPLALIPVPPDLAVEVISPTDLMYDVMEKVEEYLAAGVKLVWIVQPNTRSVSIRRVDGTVSELRSNDDITGESVLPGFRCKVAEFFATMSPT